MSFGGTHYFLLLAVTALASQAAPGRYRKWIMLAGSLTFYGLWSVPLLAVPLWCAIVGFAVGRALEGRSGAAQTRLLIVGIVGAMLPLLQFKYVAKAIILLSSKGFLGGSPLVQHVVLPLGISFYTFQVVGYLVDVSRGDEEASTDFWEFLLFVIFFPNLVAGPIERARGLLSQLKDPTPRITLAGIQGAVWLIAIGIFKKKVFADPIAPVVDEVFDKPFRYHGLEVVLCFVLARYQFYCDFSGYTDIARGSARLAGFELRENFERPFLASNIAEFWRRWHMSLSHWMRDYLYYPLVAALSGRGRLGGRAIMFFAVVTTFLCLGVWHGLSVNFAVYGLLQGLMIGAYVTSAGLRSRLIAAIGLDRHPALLHVLAVVFTFTFCVCPPFVFFWLRDFGAAVDVLSAVGTLRPGWLSVEHLGGALDGKLPLLAAGLAVLELCNAAEEKWRASAWFAQQPFYLRWAVYWLLAGAYLYLADLSDVEPFRYSFF